MTDAQVKFIGTLQTAGMIHPYAGHEKVVLDALDEYARTITREVEDALDTHAEEIEDAANNHGQGPVLVKDATETLPSAEDLDAVAAEQLAKQATSGEVARPDPAPQPECAGPFASAFDCPVHDPRKATSGESEPEPQSEPAAESQSQEAVHGD